ncbi:putative ABC transporter extracellular-binding protein YurO [Clostridia bacterium]|nr:putative ABC transporter extracellular-binding protein YurO [Clostridia bacterium]
MKKHVLKTVVSVCLASVLMVGAAACSSKAEDPTNAPTANTATEAPASTGLAYKGELSLMHFSTSEESQGNGGSDGFRTVNAQWEQANSGVKVVASVLSNDEYKSKVATLAAAGDLPDVFLLQGMNTKTWAEQGLITDLTSIIAASPYAADYDMSKLFPFTAGDKYYAFPVLTEGSCTMFIYDEEAYAAAGFSTFPETWDEIVAAKDKFGAAYPVAFGNSGKWQVNSCFLSTAGDRFTGHDWYYSMVNKGGAAFTDKSFVDALKFTQDIFLSGIFNPDYNAVNNEEAREYYISGKAAAFIGGNWDTSYIYATLKESDPARLDKTHLAVIPQPGGATGATKSHNTGLGYGVAISSKVTGDKLTAAVDLAEYITGPAFAKYVAENYALTAFTKVSNVDLSKFDRFTQDFYNFYSNPGCEIYDSYLTGAVWDVMNTDLQDMINGNLDPQKVAENAQKAYVDTY